MRTSLPCVFSGRVVVALLATVLVARSQPTPAPAASSAPTSREIITLNEFDVSGAATTGYQAANSISATGIGTKSYDVPLPIMVITSDFLSDTGALDMRDAIQNVPGVMTDPRNESAFTLRGFSGNIVYRDGFYRRQNYQTWDMDRIEVIEGPAAIFFGSVRPGGIINYVTTRPSFSGNFGELNLQAGSFSFERAFLTYNYVANPELAVRVSLGGLDSNGNGYQYDFMLEDHASVAATWKPTANSVLNFYVDKERRNDYLDERGYALTHPGYLGNPTIPAGESVTTWVAANYGPNAPVLTEFAPIFPAKDVYGRGYAFDKDNFEKFNDWDVDLDYLVKINKNMVWEIALSRGQDDQPGLRAINGDETPFANGTVNFDYEYFENNRNSYDMANKFTAKFDLGPVKNTLQLGQQYQEVRTDQPGFISPSGSFSTNNFSTTITGFNPITSAPLTNDLASVFANQPINDWLHSIDITDGYYAALQSALFDDRVHLLAGARYDIIDGSHSYSVKPTNATQEGRSTATTPQVGIIGEIIPGLSAYATYSRSIEPQNGDIDAFGQVAGPVRSTGYDTGIKTNFLDGKLSATAEFFYLQRADIATTDTARQLATGISPLFIFGTVNQSNGIALDANLVTSDNNQLIVGYQHFTKANIVGAPLASASTIGEPLADVPTNTGSVFDHYTFRSGELKSWAIGAGGRYSGSAPIASATNETVRDPAFMLFNAVISRSGCRIFGLETRFQLNVENLANKVYHDGPEGMFGPPRKFIVSVDTKF